MIHIDTGHNFEETTTYRDRMVAELGARLIVGSVQKSIDSGRVVEESGLNASRNLLQTATLLDALEEHEIDAAVGGARRDEHDRRPAVPPGWPIETTGDRALKCRKVGGVVQPGLSRGDQSNSGYAVQQRVYSLDARARRRSAGSSVENVCMRCA